MYSLRTLISNFNIPPVLINVLFWYLGSLVVVMPWDTHVYINKIIYRVLYKIVSFFFQKLFILPSQVIGLVLGIQVIIIFYQLFILVRIAHWFKIVSLAIMLFFNYYPLYKVCRDFLVSYKIYKQSEDSVSMCIGFFFISNFFYLQYVDKTM